MLRQNTDVIGRSDACRAMVQISRLQSTIFATGGDDMRSLQKYFLLWFVCLLSLQSMGSYEFNCGWCQLTVCVCSTFFRDHEISLCEVGWCCAVARALAFLHKFPVLHRAT